MSAPAFAWLTAVRANSSSEGRLILYRLLERRNDHGLYIGTSTYLQ